MKPSLIVFSTEILAAHFNTRNMGIVHEPTMYRQARSETLWNVGQLTAGATRYLNMDFYSTILIIHSWHK